MKQTATILFVFSLVFVGTARSVAKEVALPARVNNAETKYFPPIAKQWANTCAEYASVYYMLGYELNVLRDTEATDPQHRYAPRFVFNFVDKGGTNYGSEINHGFHVAKHLGVPNEATYGGLYQHAIGQWMHGYDRWYAAMKNRAEAWQWMRIANLEELQAAKRWLFDRGDERRKPGGLLAFDAMSYGATLRPAADGAQKGKVVVVRWKPGPGHIMTICGYDDTVGVDVNGDGRITNDIDITGDGKIEVDDLERGTFLVANSFGADNFGNDGFAYALYSNFGAAKHQPGTERTLWAARLTKVADHEPTMTLKIKMSANDRQGISVKLTATRSDGTTKSIEPFLFRRGQPDREHLEAGQEETAAGMGMFASGRRDLLGRVPLRGPQQGETLEMGFDLSELSDAVRGQKAADFTLEVGVYQQEEGTIEYHTKGKVFAASLLFYRDGKPIKEVPFPANGMRYDRSNPAVMSALVEQLD